MGDQGIMLENSIDSYEIYSQMYNFVTFSIQNLTGDFETETICLYLFPNMLLL